MAPSMWQQTQEMAKKHDQNSSVWLKLQNDGDRAVIVFLGEPHPREVAFIDGKYVEVDEKMKAEGHKASLRVALNVALFDTQEVKVLEQGVMFFKDLVRVRDKYGLDNELPLPAAGVRAGTYASDAGAADREVPTFVLGLWRNGKRCSWDARLLRQVVGPVRHLLDEIRSEVVDVIARGPSERPAMEALVRRVLVGHDESDEPISEPHLAILPLPSVLGPYPDGRVRRIALADFGRGDDSTRRAIVETAQVLLHGRELPTKPDGPLGRHEHACLAPPPE